MNHKPEFSEPVIPGREFDRPALDMAARYARLFLSDDGKIVLNDLLAKFDPAHPLYSIRDGALDPLEMRGMLKVLHEIRKAVHIATPQNPIPE